MANEPNKSVAPLAAPNSANTEVQKQVERSNDADRLAKTAMPAEPAEDAPRNLTRESMELTLEAQFIAAGKSADEAKSAAKKRALEIIPADAK